MNRRVIWGAVVLTSTTVAIAVVVAPMGIGTNRHNNTDPTASIVTGDETPGTAALRAYINPETGELEVGSAPAAAVSLDKGTQEALRRDAVGLLEKHHPGGAVSYNLEGRFQSVSVAHRGADGKVRVAACTDDAEGVLRALEGQTGAAEAEVK